MSRASRDLLTKRQREILTILADHPDDDEGEIAYERGMAYLGDTRIAARTVFALIGLCAISLRSGNRSVGQCERYSINETGLRWIGRKP